MFTGIIQEIGTVSQVARSRGLVRLTVTAPTTARRVVRLDSVAVDGACLTVTGVRGPLLSFDIIEETQRLTSLRRLRAGARVNLEPSLALSDRLNGHIVLGHVDGTGTVVKRRQLASELVLEIRVPRALRALLVPKGPVTVDGVSLTVGARLGTATFQVHLIPETLRQTTLMARQPGDPVNLELDYLAKLVREWMGSLSGVGRATARPRRV